MGEDLVVGAKGIDDVSYIPFRNELASP